MIIKIFGRVILNNTEINYIASLKPHNGKQWEIKDDTMENLKKIMKYQLNNLQNEKCAYCGIVFKGINEKEIEHIAPKASYRYPQFTFELENLVLSCHHCNTFGEKGTTDTIDFYNDTYSFCTFKLVHPFYDDPNEHYDWVDNLVKVLIFPKTPKGKYSIDMFKLDHPNQSEKRAGQHFLKELITDDPLEQLIQKIVTYKSIEN